MVRAVRTGLRRLIATCVAVLTLPAMAVVIDLTPSREGFAVEYLDVYSISMGRSIGVQSGPASLKPDLIATVKG